MKKIIEIIIILGLLAVLFFIGRNKLAAYYYNRADGLLEQGQYKEAEKYFLKSLGINPTLAFVYYGLANTYHKEKLFDQAIAEYKKVIERDPEFGGAYKALAQIYSSRKMYAQALDLLKKASSLSPGDPEIEQMKSGVSFEYVSYCLNKGVSAFLAKNKLAAYELVNKAIEINPDFAFSHYTLAYFYYADKKGKEALASLNQALRLEPNFGAAHKLFGNIYFEKGDYSEAAKEYKAGLSSSPDDFAIYNNLGITLMNLERYLEATAYLKEALKLNDNINTRYSLASVYRDSAKFPEAESEYKLVILQQGDYPNVHNDLGDIYKKQGREQEAREEYAKEIEYSRRKLLGRPDDAVTLTDLAYAYSQTGELALANKSIKNALTLKPDSRQAYLVLAKLKEKQGQSEEALAALTKAKTLIAQAGFIDKEIIRLKEELKTVTKHK